jgi:hypothetical protein
MLKPLYSDIFRVYYLMDVFHILLHLITLIEFCRVQITNLLITNITPASCYCLVLKFKSYHQHRVLIHSQYMSSWGERSSLIVVQINKS